MGQRLEGKRILVTAAAQGIGRASVLMMAAEGARVIATDVNAALLDALKGTPGIETRRLDVLDDAEVAAVVGAQPLDVLFNCAGWVHQGGIEQCTDRDWDLSFNLNVRAQWKAIAAALPAMLAQGGGSIINMASMCSSLKGFANRFAYGASKAAVIGLTKSVAIDYVARGIRCNCICPGTVDTPSLGDRINAFADPEEARKMFVARQPMGRLATPEEIAPIAVYLASDESRFATGQPFLVDGGTMIDPHHKEEHMKLVRYGKPGKERPGLVDADGVLRDLSGIVPDIGPAQLSSKSLAKLAKLKPAKLPAVEGKPRMGIPFSGSTKFVAIGLNYSDHAAETNNPNPKEPIVFHKTLSCMIGPDDDVMLPKGSKKTDWEVELGIVIGKTARNVSKRDALSHVAGYCVVNDVSEREWQLERGPTWDKGKGFDTFGPIGPWLVTPDEVGNPGKLDMWLDVNGVPRQRGSTKTMIFDCATLVAYVSGLFTLNPGDLITTGTPPGVAMGMKPTPVFLKAGDVMTLGIEGLGEQRQKVVKYSA